MSGGDTKPEKETGNISSQNAGSLFSEDFFKMLLLHANVWVAFIDSKARVKIWNSAAEQMSGYSADEVMDSDQVWTKLYPDKEYRQEITEKIDKILQETEVLDKFESRIIRKDGETRIISWNTKGIKRKSEEIEGYFIIGLDITDIVRAEGGLKLLLMNANVVITFLDKESRVRIWNRFAEEISGYKADEVLGSDGIWKKIYPDPEYRKYVTKNIIEIVSDPERREMFETEILTKSGDKKKILWNTKEIYDYDRNIDGYIAIGLDITREKEMQAEIFNYIGNSVMRLKYPVEIIRDNLWELHEKIEGGDIKTEDLLLELKIQVKNSEQILRNLHELNENVRNSFEEMPEDMKDFLLK